MGVKLVRSPGTRPAFWKWASIASTSKAGLSELLELFWARTMEKSERDATSDLNIVNDGDER